MGIERGEHAADGVGEYLAVVDRVDIVLFNLAIGVQHFAQCRLSGRQVRLGGMQGRAQQRGEENEFHGAGLLVMQRQPKQDRTCF